MPSTTATTVWPCGEVRDDARRLGSHGALPLSLQEIIAPEQDPLRSSRTVSNVEPDVSKMYLPARGAVKL